LIVVQLTFYWEKTLNSNTKANRHAFPGIGATPFDPSGDFMWGFKGPTESLRCIIESDNRLLAELGVTHEQIASVIDAIFASDEDQFCGCPMVRWENIHSPICPWGDFCTRSCFDLTVAVTEIWLVNPWRVAEVQTYLKGVTKRVYPINDLKMLVDNEWVMVFSDLHPHLIREHHFFEGLETPYRVHPRKMARMI
jgi:hypothetical protein